MAEKENGSGETSSKLSTKVHRTRMAVPARGGAEHEETALETEPEGWVCASHGAQRGLSHKLGAGKGKINCNWGLGITGKDCCSRGIHFYFYLFF